MKMDFVVEPIPAFTDNYIWLLTKPGCQTAACVDPGSADEVLDVLHARKLELTSILITHHHHDHIGGLDKLVSNFPQTQVFAPQDERISLVTETVAEGSVVELADLACTFQVFEVPGHTRSHIAYYGHACLFCGDTVFACGCGRLFEGSAQQMHDSISKIKRLPDDTRIFCAHEYTLANIDFAKQVEPGNAVLLKREQTEEKRRREGVPTVPSLLATEKETNPFLRWDQPAVIQAASRFARKNLSAPVDVFAQIRQWKDQYR